MNSGVVSQGVSGYLLRHLDKPKNANWHSLLPSGHSRSDPQSDPLNTRAAARNLPTNRPVLRRSRTEPSESLSTSTTATPVERRPTSTADPAPRHRTGQDRTGRDGQCQTAGPLVCAPGRRAANTDRSSRQSPSCLFFRLHPLRDVDVVAEIDLSQQNASNLRQGLEEYVSKGRRTGGRAKRGSSRGRPGAEKANTGAIRDWAQAQGLKVFGRGRISAEVAQAYRGAHMN